MFLIGPVVTEVDVIYIDYGNREKVKISKLRVLPDQFCVLPAQAICCALAEVIIVVMIFCLCLINSITAILGW